MHRQESTPPILLPNLTYYQRLPQGFQFLYGGTIIITNKPSAIVTVLGSCVSICLFDTNRIIGGMNHYILPHAPNGEQTSARYGECAYDKLLRDMLRAGATKQSLVAKVYGGASIISNPGSEGPSIGTRNSHLAIERLNADRIPILEIDVGGVQGRKIAFRTDDGSVVVHKAVNNTEKSPCFSESIASRSHSETVRT